MVKHQIDVIKAMLMNKEITYDQAKKMAMPIIDMMNKKSEEVAKKHKMRPKYFNFSGLMR